MVTLGKFPGQPPLLKIIGTVTIRAKNVPFVVGEEFMNGNPGIRCSDRFKAWFSKKTEEPIGKTTLRCAMLQKVATNRQILGELGDKAKTMISQIARLLLFQADGEKGVLLTNGWVNIFYVEDSNGKLREVCLRWNGDDWYVYAYSVATRDLLADGVQVFSRDS